MKLLKGAKRIPLLLEEHSSSSNLLFSLGSWHTVIRPSLRYWDNVKGDNSCHIGNYVIKILGVQIGKDSKGKNVDSKIVFFADGNKVVCHFYNTTQRILINGTGYKKLINLFLQPFFMSRIDSCHDDIRSYNENALSKLGHKTVRRADVRYRGGMPFECNDVTMLQKPMQHWRNTRNKIIY